MHFKVGCWDIDFLEEKLYAIKILRPSTQDFYTYLSRI